MHRWMQLEPLSLQISDCHLFVTDEQEPFVGTGVDRDVVKVAIDLVFQPSEKAGAVLVVVADDQAALRGQDSGEFGQSFLPVADVMEDVAADDVEEGTGIQAGGGDVVPDEVDLLPESFLLQELFRGAKRFGVSVGRHDSHFPICQQARYASTVPGPDIQDRLLGMLDERQEKAPFVLTLGGLFSENFERGATTVAGPRHD